MGGAHQNPRTDKADAQLASLHFTSDPPIPAAQLASHLTARISLTFSVGRVVLHGSEVPFPRMVGRIVLRGSEVPFPRMVGRIVLHGSEVHFPRMVGRIVLHTD